MGNAKATTSTKDVVYQVSAGVSNAILVCLGVGLLLQSISNFVHWQPLSQIGQIAQILLPASFGVAIASMLKTNTLVIFSSMIASTVGSNGVFFTGDKIDAVTATGHAATQAASAGVFTTGQPISAVLAGLAAALIGKYLTGKTPLDMMLVPFTATLVGSLIGLGLAAVTTPALIWVSHFIAQSMAVNPLVGSVLIALAWAVFLMTPASSAALAVAIMLDPVSSAAALIGTTAQFVGFTAMSFKENNLGANIAQSVVTPKIQFPNLMLNPRLVIPPFVAAIVCAPIATMLFHFETSYKIAGLGLNSFIAPINLASNDLRGFMIYVACGVVLPIIISVVVQKVLVKLKWIEAGQLNIEVV
ncbi:PTS transporter subunit IIC [Enterococcus sp. CSURQ0835]|uniref:PTS transporter subunit IIC n=1 Tax=Enterococcus sp. CSURQ0835 TaxID=2681394 RepID=UPI001357810D|nr:PTS sugar transporter subunit IIC [Enterococcus sp. CSURQ0835]